MKDEMDNLFLNFQPLEAILLLSRTESEAYKLFDKTVDRVVIAREALRLPVTTFDHRQFQQP